MSDDSKNSGASNVQISRSDEQLVGKAAVRLLEASDAVLPGRPDLSAHALALAAGAQLAQIVGGDVEIVVNTLRNSAAAHVKTRNMTRMN